MVINRTVGLALIRDGKARAESLVYRDHPSRTYVALTRFDTQHTDHYPVGDGDLRDTAAGRAAEAETFQN